MESLAPPNPSDAPIPVHSDQVVPAEASAIPLSDLREPGNFELATQDPAAKQTKRLLGRSVLIRAGTEIVGLGVDAALMGAGHAGVGALQSVVTREVTATVPEVAVLDRLLPHGHQHETNISPSRLRKFGRRALNLALGVGTAVMVQKAAPGLVEHVAANLNHEMGHYAIPLTAKVGAMSALNNSRTRFAARRARSSMRA
jgi:hypothetical protein